ncbi:MAG TPA: type II toxin-antitoxin system prevent-host-death family antitoxin [Thermoanaerobaculia bacterium]|jgi:prevent-host-death family protein|nr:type II toxin-antitoxin system prevent-host-death family antitoxin [Thermoanaerobaculia bacterium]
MKTIPQRELRNQSGSVLREAQAGQLFTITVDGRPVALLGPVPRRQWVGRAEYGPLLLGTGRDPGFFADLAELGESIERLDEPWEPRRR